MKTVESRPRPSRLRGLGAVLVAVLCLVLGSASAAQAHTELASSNPAEGSTVTAPLPAVDLTFTGSVLLRQVTVTGPDGAPAVSGAATAAGAVVTQPVALSAAGTYTIGYAVTSSDGHAVEGTVTFTYAPPAAASPTRTTPPAETAPTEPAGPAEPAEAAAESSTADSSGIPVWAVVAVAAAVLAGAVLAVRRVRSRT